MIYIIQDVLAFIPFYIFWYINKKGRVMVAAYIAITSTILGSILLSDVKFIEYLMVVFALPIGMSSFIIRPSSSFIFAALTAILYTIASIFANYAWEYNLTAILALFALAFMSWVTASCWKIQFKKITTSFSTCNIQIKTFGRRMKAPSKAGLARWKSATAKHRAIPNA